MESSIPQETETIAVKRANRIAEKLRNGKGLKVYRAWWSSEYLDILAVLGLLVLQLYLIYPFFGTPSIETSYSGPVVPFLSRVIGLSGIPMPYAYQIVNIVFFISLPITFYIFVKKVSERRAIALLATLFVSLPTSPFGYIRIISSFSNQDAPHIASLTLVPLALYGLLIFVRAGGVKYLVVASVSAALVALTSPFGFLTYSVFAAIIAFSEFLLGKGRLKIMRLLVVLIFSGGLCSFWYNPGFFIWMITSPMGDDIRETLVKMIPISLFSLPVLATFGYLLFDRKPNLQPLFLASFFTIAFTMIVMAGGGVMLSHPNRYAPELGLSLSFLLSLVVIIVSDLLRFSKVRWVTKMGPARVASGIIVFVTLLLVAGLIFGKGKIMDLEIEVLGVWTDVNKGDMWIAKERYGGVSTLLGYLISSVSAFALFSMMVRSKKAIL